MKKWFENKTVALIGNSESLFTKNYGKEIDSHNVVVRLNKAAMLYECFDVKDSHGTRTDVWMFWNTHEYKRHFNRIDSNIKKVHMGYQDKNNLDLDLEKIDCVYPTKLYENLKKISGNNSNPTTGFMSIDYILHCEPLMLSIYGFDWKETPTFTDPSRKKEKYCPHDHKAEKEYCAKYILPRKDVFYKN